MATVAKTKTQVAEAMTPSTCWMVTRLRIMYDSITGQLSGTGTFTLTIDVSTLGIAGVSTVGDIDTFFLAFAGNETTGGTTWVDNLVITVPEPSSTALLGLGLSSILLRRKRS